MGFGTGDRGRGQGTGDRIGARVQTAEGTDSWRET